MLSHHQKFGAFFADSCLRQAGQSYSAGCDHQKYMGQWKDPLLVHCLVDIRDVHGNTCQITELNYEERDIRLTQNQAVLLYYETDLESTLDIQRDGLFSLSPADCMLGSAIYFAPSTEGAVAKARYHGVMITCLVSLGHVKDIPRNQTRRLSLTGLLREGYDSATVDCSRTGREFAVYSHEQVKILSMTRS